MNEKVIPPKLLYKYQSVNEKTMMNLREHQIWFSKPFHFNDPYDCAIRLGIDEMTDEQLTRCYPIVRAASDERQVRDEDYLTDGKPNVRFRDEVIRGAERFLSNDIMRGRGLACFSEVKDNLLMWAHYAQSHHGFCLEFVGTSFPFNKARNVEYSRTIPSINPASVLLGEQHVIFPMILTKANCWAYEKEWRIFHLEGDVAHKYSVDCLTGIYFGVNMELEHKLEIMNILKDSPTRIYEMSKSESEYRLTCKEMYLVK